MPLQSPPLTSPPRLEAEATQACRQLLATLGQADGEPHVLGRFSNLAVDLPHLGWVARVNTGTAPWRHGRLQAGLEMAVARVLSDQRAPSVRPLSPELAGPHDLVWAGQLWVISLWHKAVVLPKSADPVQAGQALAHCHFTLTTPTAQARLPTRPPWGMLDETARLLEDPRLPSLGAAPETLQCLRDQTQTLGQRLKHWPCATQWLHGDAHLNNVWATPEGAVWGDWEDATVGPVEWDAACLVAGARVLGSHQDWSERALQAWWVQRCAQKAPPDARLLNLCIHARTLHLTAWMWALGAATGDEVRQARLAGRLAWLARQAY